MISPKIISATVALRTAARAITAHRYPPTTEYSVSVTSRDQEIVERLRVSWPEARNCDRKDLVRQNHQDSNRDKPG